MIELSEQNIVEYLRRNGRVSKDEVLVQSLSGGVANVVLKIFDTGGGEKVGADVRSSADVAGGMEDRRPNAGACFVLKQPLAKFRTEAEWRVDVERVEVERDCMTLLGTLLPANSVPDVLWFDEANKVLAMSCAPPDAVLWKKSLLAGHTSMDAATHAGMLLAIMHSSTAGDAAVNARYGDPKFFVQQRIDPYLRATGDKNPEQRPVLEQIARRLLDDRQCLIHGDYSPKNIFLVPHPDDLAAQFEPTAGKRDALPLSHLLLLDFEVAFYGHCAFDVATLINHLLLKGFYHRKKWRPFMLIADHFWQTYKSTAAPDLSREAALFGGQVLGALLLARVDGKSPVEYLVGNEAVQAQVRKAAHEILGAKAPSLDDALNLVAMHFDPPDYNIGGAPMPRRFSQEIP